MGGADEVRGVYSAELRGEAQLRNARVEVLAADGRLVSESRWTEVPAGKSVRVRAQIDDAAGSL